MDLNRESNSNPSNEIVVVKIEDDDKCEINVAEKILKQDNAIDFTADITLDQLSDENVIGNVNDVENILDSGPTTFETSEIDVDRSSLVKLSQNNNTDSKKSIKQLQDIILLDDVEDKNQVTKKSVEELWHEEKINFKIETVKQRLSKLAGEIKNNYPCYKNYLERVEALTGVALCKLDPPRSCSLDQSRINRWKFLCTRKHLNEPTDPGVAPDNTNIKTVWKLEPCEGSNTVANTPFATIPSYVLLCVEMFEDFINSMNENQLVAKAEEEVNDDDIIVLDSDQKSSNIKDNGNTPDTNTKPQWMWLLVRSNSKNELMMFTTGKFITHRIMESLKHLFESGLGRNCNVKSLYCKSVTKTNNVQTSNTTFLVGAEALDEVVGSVKIQLAPKTNFWLSTAGAEELVKTVESVLDPSILSTVIDIGCGLGLIGLTLARKCYQIIGVDSKSEVEEAEMTCELNKIKNAYYLTGEPKEMMTTIQNTVDWRVVFAVVNANTNIGRTTDIMTGLRKIKHLRRLVMVTSLTRQSVRSILELTRPADDIRGDPFVVTKATVVDTLPNGPQFEIVLLMERYPMPQIHNAVLFKISPDLVAQNPNKKTGKNTPKKNNIQKSVGNKSNFVKNTLAIRNRKGGLFNKKILSSENKGGLGNIKGKQPEKPHGILKEKLVKNPFYDKPVSPRNRRMSHQKKLSGAAQPSANQNTQILLSPSKPLGKSITNLSPRMKNEINNTSFGFPIESPKRKSDWDTQSRSRNNTFIPDKRLRENNDNFHPVSSSNREVERGLFQKMQEQQRLLETAKQKLTSSSRVVDDYTAKEVQNMLNLAIERTNQIQSHLPRSTWKRDTFHGRNSPEIIAKDEIILKECRIKELNEEDIIITTSNQKYRETFDATWMYKRHSDIPPLEPNLILPKDRYTVMKPISMDLESPEQKAQRELHETRWIPPSCTRRPLSPSKPLMLSPLKNDFSSHQHQQPSRPSQDIVNRNQMPSTSRSLVPLQRPLSPLRQNTLGLTSELLHRRHSPPRQQSPIRRSGMSIGFGDQWNIPTRGAVEQQSNWHRTTDNRPPTNDNNRRDFINQQDNFRPGNNLQLNWDGKNPVNDNRSNRIGSGDDSWNNKLITARPSINQWPQQSPENQFGRPSNNDWNIRGKDELNVPSNIRNEPWKNVNYNPRWNEPQQRNKKSWNRIPLKEDWNDLPEDAKDPWGDETNSIGQPPSSWNRMKEVDSWTTARDNRQNSNLSMMNFKQNWSTNTVSHNQNSNDFHWNGKRMSNDRNWQQGNNSSNTNNWRPQKPFEEFPRPKPFN